jgi:glycosyltransferase involved in cell wall biosynthesis
MAPLVSVVTPSLNMAEYLPQAIESVLHQDYSRIEYLVMDGGSTDGTLDVLRRYENRLSYWSAPDDGPADAAHRGLSLASGKILAWLNADDAYLPGAIQKAVDCFVAHPDVDVVYGEGYWIDEGGKVLDRYPTLQYDFRELERDCFICQPATFIRTEAYRRSGLDPTERWAFDYDLWIRMSKQGFKFHYLPDYLAYSRMHRSAKTLSERKQVLRSSMDLLRRHYGYVPLAWVLTYVAHRMDGRDQFFEPFRPSALKFLTSLPLGLWYNPRKPARYCCEWLGAATAGIRKRYGSWQ